MNKRFDISADNIRILSAAMVEKANSGHPGGAMGGADFINILYSKYLKFDPDNMNWFNRDRFFLDPGHMSPMLYSALYLCGLYTEDDIRNFRQWGSLTSGHPEVDVLKGIENTSGPLGQGHTMAVGAAIAERFLVSKFGEWMAHKTYAYISDGGIQEEISQGAGRIAGTLKLANLIMFYDANNIQLSTKVEEVTTEDTAKKYEAWGWRVYTINGNNAQDIIDALDKANEEKEKPTLIIGRTLMGKGIVDKDNNDFSNKLSTHGQPISGAGASLEKTIENLKGNTENPFLIFPEAKELYETSLAEKRIYAKSKQKEQEEWEKQNPDLARKLQSFIDQELPEIDFVNIEQKANMATRAASGDILKVFAERFENMIISSADLSNSDKTDGFIKGGAKNITADNFGGSFLQAGVAELTMASICNGIALHGGIITACATFFVFSDYMKPAVRIAALMELPVKYIWTHDSFRVGEDGPTHQPIEQEAQIRLMEKLRNHSGEISLIALRPADVYETNIAWEIAIKNKKTPTALILSRQNIKDIPYVDKNKQAEGVRRGGYIAFETNENVDVVLIASGSEVSTLIDAATILKDRNINSRVVSVISEGLFREQGKEYYDNVILSDKPKFGLTAGLSCTLEALVGEKGMVHGLNHFGFSAPASVLDDKFGFTGDKVALMVENFLSQK